MPHSRKNPAMGQIICPPLRSVYRGGLYGIMGSVYSIFKNAL